MTRTEALALVRKNVKTKNLVKHMLAVEAGMRALAPRFGDNPDRWALAGLVHDLDYEETKDRPDLHGHQTVALLRSLGFADEGILQAILSHAGHREPQQPLEIALTAVDPLTGLIVAAALVHPDRLAGLTPHNVLNRYREKGFARSASREGITVGTRLGMSLDEFVEIVLAAMQAARADLGL
ncbi:TPA: phosphohydrolase [Candidatus Acetothermia bacterium]|nr:phosphohydrolase [Candidatus Acetothermia bacterium]HAZ31011.1 phosphohydrolase [Candidatus Acetothermia bacterium]